MRILGLPEKKLQKLQKPGSFIKKIPMLRKWAKLLGELGFISSKLNYTALQKWSMSSPSFTWKTKLGYAPSPWCGIMDRYWQLIGIKNLQSRFSEVSGTF